MFRISSPVVHVCVVAAGSALLFAAPVPPAEAEPRGVLAQGQVDALYAITINGIDLGTLRFNSNVTGDRYKLESDVELSALLGVFRWKGVSHSEGTLVASEPQPAGFAFDFESTARQGSVRMNFGRNGVETVSIVPPLAEAADSVPLAREQLAGALDPLSAILALTHVADQSPCARSVAIFDGRQRFNLDLSYRRHVPVGAQNADLAIVCRVKYIPLGGHRANEETRALARSTGIEITFRPIAKAKLMLPQGVVIPTVAGAVELSLQRVDIKTPDSGQIALVN